MSSGIQVRGNILLRRGGLFFSILFLAAVLAVLNFFYSPGRYSAVARIKVRYSSSENAGLGGGSDKKAVMAYLRSGDMADLMLPRVWISDKHDLLSSISISTNHDGTVINIISSGNDREGVMRLANSWAEGFAELIATGRAGVVGVEKVSIQERAVIPPADVAPRYIWAFMIFLAGIFVGIALVFWLEYLDHTLRTVNGVRLHAGIPCIAEIGPGAGASPAPKKSMRLVENDPSGLMRENFRNLKASLIFSSEPNDPFKVVQVTSSLLGEGKSFVASNLAISSASGSSKTLLIDVDLKNGTIAEAYGIDNGGAGALSFLKGSTGFDDSIFFSGVDNLYVMPSGSGGEDVPGSIPLAKIYELISSARQGFQRVIIDSSDISGSHFAELMTSEVDCVLFVVGSGFTPLETVRSVLSKVRSPNIRGVLNDVALERDFYYYYRYMQYFLRNTFRNIFSG